MSEDIKNLLSIAEQKIKGIHSFLNIIALKRELEELDGLLSDGKIWSNIDKATKLSKSRNDIFQKVYSLNNMNKKIEEIKEYYDLFKTEEPSLLEDLQKDTEKFVSDIIMFNLNLILNQPADHADAILSIHAGSGGTEAKDWAGILLRMYSRWADMNNYKTEVIHLHASETGTNRCIDSVSMKISGTNAYGFLKGESGVHRLVRNSPFDADNARHTSFAAIEVLADIEDEIDIKIEEKDLECQTMTAGGPGGQHQNKTESAIRIKHVPTNIVIVCRAQRSQHQNRATAMKMLKAKLYDIELKKKQESKDKELSEKNEMTWGSQIRSYVLSPYQLVTDYRSETKINDADGVLDGNLHQLLEAYIYSK